MKLNIMQKEYILAKPARDAAAKAKMETGALSAVECPLHDDNEWNIRCLMFPLTSLFHLRFEENLGNGSLVGIELRHLIVDALCVVINCNDHII